MASPFRRTWLYLKALLSFKLDQHADVRVQLHQNMEAMRDNHAKLIEQAANVIGNQKSIEMKLHNKTEERNNLESAVRQALKKADALRTRAPEEAAKYERIAEQLAGTLVSVESMIDSLTGMHGTAVQASQQARDAVENNTLLIRQEMAKQEELMAKIDQAEMVETLSKSLESVSSMTSVTSTSSTAALTDKVEKRYATSAAKAELAADSTELRLHEMQKLTMNSAAQERLEALRGQVREIGQ